MRIDKKKVLTLLVLTLLIVSLVFVNLKVSRADPTMIYVDPPQIDVWPPSTTFSVDINIDYVVDLMSFEFKLGFDPTVLTVVNATDGGFLDVFASTINNTAGYVHVGAAKLFPPGTTGGSPPPLATVYFHCEGVGNSTLHLYNTSLLDSDLIEIPHTTADGWVDQETQSRYLHKEESLLPVNLHKVEPIVPVHIHPVGPFDPAAPLGSLWHELYPQYSNDYILNSWNDTDGSGNLTVSDQIDLMSLETGEVTWYHLDRVTWTIFIEELYVEPPPPPLYAELETPPMVIPPPIIDPVSTDWHVVYPPENYSRRFHISSWNDTGDPFGEFSPSDLIDVWYYDEFEIRWYHVLDLTMDLILTKKCFYEPISTEWHELYPNFSQYYHLSSWNDTNKDGKLSPSDQIDLHVDWPKFHHDNPLSGYSVSTAPNTNTTLWSYNTTAPVYSSPAIVDNILYIGSTDNKTYALDATTGAVIWTYTTGGPIMSSPAVFYGKVYFLSTDGFIYALDAATGALVWSLFIDPGPTPWSSPAVHNGKVFIAASNGTIFCLNAFNGAVVWRTFIGGNPNGPITVANNKVFSGTHNFNASLPTLVALNEITGAVVWTYNYTASVPGVAGMVNSNGAAVVDGDGDGDLEVYFGIVAWNLTGPPAVGEAIALHESNGTEIWRYTFLNFIGVGGMGPGWSTSTPAVHGGKVFIGSDDQNIYALNAATGAKIWNYTTGAAVWSAPAVADGKVFAGALDHILYALNETTGALIWSYNTSKSRLYGSPAVACGKVFVGSENGKVYAFGTEETKVHWYHVNRVTVTILLKEMHVETPQQLYAEFKGSFDMFFEPIVDPMGTDWHIVYPPKNYSRSFNISSWIDNGDGVFGPSDQIDIYDIDTGEFLGWYHVEEVACDIKLTKKCFYDPISSHWHELYPQFSRRYHITSWEDTNEDGKLSPSDQIDTECACVIEICTPVCQCAGWFHVDNVTLTINITEKYVEEPQQLYAEFMGSFDMFFEPIMNAVSTDWHVVYPPENFSQVFHIYSWEDNGDGVFGPSDQIDVRYEHEPEVIRWYHVEEVACDIIITEKPGPPPPPPLYWKANFTDYAPSGMPDFDQRQDKWRIGAFWSWCVPSAVADSLWWMDSRFETSTTPPPTINNTFGLVGSYNPTGPVAWDDHDPKNAFYLIKHLGYLMDTDGNRTAIPHIGTDVFDMQAGIAHYLSWRGVNPQGDVNGDGIVNMTDWNIVNASLGSSVVGGVPQPGPQGQPWNMAADIWPVTRRILAAWPFIAWPGADNVVNASDLAIVTANMNATGMFYEQTVPAPTFEFVEGEVERSEDVVLVIAFWQWDPVHDWTRWDLGHAVTVAGVNSTALQIAISDPGQDNAEPLPQGTNGPGRVLPPPPHPHAPVPPYPLHNNATYVSHDIYNVTGLPPGFPPGIANFTLVNYSNPQFPLGLLAVVEWAVIVSPTALAGIHDVAVIDVTPSQSSVVQNSTLLISVTVENQGNFTETFNVTAYANTTAIQTLNVTSLPPGSNTTLTFTWDTTGFATGNYTISANATIVLGETDTADNTYIDGTVTIKPKPPSVGGIWILVDKLGLLAPYIALASTILVAIVATAIYVKRRKKKQ